MQTLRLTLWLGLGLFTSPYTIAEARDFDPTDVSVDSPADAVQPALSGWTAQQLATIDSLRLQKLPEPADPSNRFLGNRLAIELGGQLFHDTKLSHSDTISCATCHQPSLAYTDGQPLAIGTTVTQRNTPSLLNVAHHPWFYWDGRRDSAWAQALTPIETPGEMNNNRSNVVRYFLSSPDYRPIYVQLGGAVTAVDVADLPDNAGPFDPKTRDRWQRLEAHKRRFVNRIYADMGKFIASFEATLTHTTSRFDRFADALVEGSPKASTLLGATEQLGLRLFIDTPKSQCLRCHEGPLFSNFAFHNIATGLDAKGNYDYGRYFGQQAVQNDPFNCTGSFSDTRRCDHVAVANVTHFARGAFKVPTLRHLKQSAPYFHDGRFANLTEVVDYYRQLPTALPGEIAPVTLSIPERDALVAFLATLNGEG